jgi:hypothetical protein
LILSQISLDLTVTLTGHQKKGGAFHKDIPKSKRMSLAAAPKKHLPPPVEKITADKIGVIKPSIVVPEKPVQTMPSRPEPRQQPSPMVSTKRNKRPSTFASV